jgi:hypothetical protein
MKIEPLVHVNRDQEPSWGYMRVLPISHNPESDDR